MTDGDPFGLFQSLDTEQQRTLVVRCSWRALSAFGLFEADGSDEAAIRDIQSLYLETVRLLLIISHNLASPAIQLPHPKTLSGSGRYQLPDGPLVIAESSWDVTWTQADAAFSAWNAAKNNAYVALHQAFSALSTDVGSPYDRLNRGSDREAVLRLALNDPNILAASELTHDLKQLQDNPEINLLREPLFSQIAVIELEENYEITRAVGVMSYRLGSAYWQEVFVALLNGEPIDWQFARKVAKIDEVHWEDGAEAVGLEINRLQAEHLAQQTALAEDVFYNEATARVSRNLIPMQHPKTMATLLGALRDALEDASQGNGLTERAFEYRKLDRMMTKYAHNPERVEMDVVQVWGSLQRQMDDNHLPDTPELMGLCDVLDETRREIHALHPTIKDARARRMLEGVRGASEDEKVQMRDGVASIHAVVEAEFADEIVEDLEDIIDGAGDTDAAARAGNRLAKTWLVLKAAVAGTGVSAGAIVAIDQALPVLQNLWQILSKLLGIG